MIRSPILASLALTAALAASGCTSLAGVAKLEPAADAQSPEPTAFPGLLSGAGLDETPAAVRYVFHTHGMGLTDADEVLLDPVKRALEQEGYRREGGAAGSPWIDAPTKRPHDFRGEALNCEGGAALQKPCRFESFGQYRVDRFINPALNRRVVVYSYFWHGDLWRIQKPFLEHDEAGLKSGFAGWTAGWISGGLKQSIVNEGLSDVAAYLGPAGEPLRQGMSSAVCLMLREAAGAPVAAETHNASLSVSPSDCLTDAQSSDLLESDARISFISHSLGSRMLFDVLSEPTSRALTDGTPTKSLVATRRATDTFFMAANQLSLLGIGRIQRVEGNGTSDAQKSADKAATAGCPTTLPGFLTVTCRTPRDAQGRNKMTGGLSEKAVKAIDARRDLAVIGFFDPGDVLGYSLMGGRAGEPPADIRFISVLHRNTPQILRLGSNPAQAHDNELALESRALPWVGLARAQDAPPRRRDAPAEVFRSPTAVAMILCGAKADSPDRLKARKCHTR